MADRQTRVLGGNGSSVQAFTLDPGLLQYVQSVHVKIDNSGGGDTVPTLTVQTNNGVDIAKKEQGRPIPAGDSGSATWALRLDDELDLAAFIRYVFANTGAWFSLHTTSHGGPDGGGISLVSEGGWGINFICEGGPIVIRGDQVQILDSAGAGTDISPDGPLSLKSFSGAVQIQSDDNVQIQPGDDLAVFLTAGRKLEVLDRNEDPIFRVNEDGSLQGKTGKALTFNL